MSTPKPYEITTLYHPTYPDSAVGLFHVPAMTTEKTAAWYEAFAAVQEESSALDYSAREYVDSALRAFQAIK